MMPTILGTDEYPETTFGDILALDVSPFEFSCHHESTWGRENGWLLNCGRPADHDMPHACGFTFIARWNR